MRYTCLLSCLTIWSQPLLAQQTDSSLFTPAREFRFGISNISLKRAVAMSGSNISYSNATLRGVEVLTMGSQGGGARIRYETGTVDGASLASGKLENLVGSLILGRHEFAIVPGYRLTTMTWNGERRFHMPELGVEGGRHFAGAGVHVKAGVNYRRMLSEAEQDSVTGSGLEARTSVVYVPPRLPVFLELGYRRDVMAFSDPSKIVVRREETSSVIISIGLQSGLSVR